MADKRQEQNAKMTTPHQKSRFRQLAKMFEKVVSDTGHLKPHIA